MCELCSEGEEKKVAVIKHLAVASSLGRLSENYADLARGYIKPHTEDAKRIGERARSMIRTLVEDWL